ANEIVERLWKCSDSCKIPVVTDVSSCAYTLLHIRPVLSDDNKIKYDQLQLLDSVEYLHDAILPVIKNVHKKESIVLHPVCSLEKMGTTQKFIAVARFFANSVTVPAGSGCCGMAGDRGFLFPELTASATAPEASQVKQNSFNGYYSSTNTSEI